MTDVSQRAAAVGRDPASLALLGGLAVGPVDPHWSRLARGYHVTAADRADEERRRVGTAQEALDQVGAAHDAGFTHLRVGPGMGIASRVA
jgi:hypothetical protein